MKKGSRKIMSVVGLGVVGLPVALAFATTTFDSIVVTGIDRDEERRKMIEGGSLPFCTSDEKLAKTLKLALSKGRFNISDNYDSIFRSDYVLVCVGLDVDESGSPSYYDFDKTIKMVGKHMKIGTFISIETTVPPETTLKRIAPMLEKYSTLYTGKEFFLVHSPERVTLSRLSWNLECLPKLVGGVTRESTQRGVELYKLICKRVVPTSSRISETTKLVENSYRDVNIAFSNEVAEICDKIGIDVLQVRKHVNSLPNVGGNETINPKRNMHFPGTGVGGYCLPKDSWLLRSVGLSSNSVIEEARYLNNRMPKRIVEKLLYEYIKKDRVKNLVLILGRSFLPDCEDDRNSPARVVEKLLEKHHIRSILHDPFFKKNDFDLKDFFEMECVSSIILVTEHSYYKEVFKRQFFNKLRSQRVVAIDSLFKCFKEET